MDTNPPPDPKKVALQKKESEINSRYHHLRYAADDYDRAKGKGAFKKFKPDAQKLLDELLNERLEMATKLAKIEAPDSDSEEANEAPRLSIPIV